MQHFTRLLIAAICVLLLAAGTTLRARQQPRTTTSVNVKDYGAVGDGQADDTEAIRSAMDAMASTTANSAVLFFPAGTYRITDKVFEDFKNKQSNIIIRGTGSMSQIQFAIDSTNTGFSLAKAISIKFQDLTFIGIPEMNIGRGIFLDTINQAVFENVHFYGVNSFGYSWGGALVATNSRLALRDVSFRGCGGDSNNNTGNVTVFNWRDISLDNVEFLDFGAINGVNYSTRSSPDGWVRLGNPLISSNSYNSFSGGFATFRNVVSDEGGASTLKAYVDGDSQIQSIIIEGWRANNGVLNGFWFNGVHYAVIRNSQMAYQPSVVQDGFNAVLATNVDTLEIVNSQFLFNSNRITLGTGVRQARITDSVYTYLTNTGGALVEEAQGNQRSTQTFLGSTAPASVSGNNFGSLYYDSSLGTLRASLNGSPYFNINSGSAPTTLSDSFASSSIDETKWVAKPTDNIEVNQSGGTLNFNVASSCGCDDSASLTSVNSYDFTKYGSASVQIIQHPDLGNPDQRYYELALEVVQNGSAIYSMKFDSASNRLTLTDDAGATQADYDFIFWRIRYSEGQIIFETSPDGQARWVVKRTAKTNRTPTNVQLRLRVRAAFSGSVVKNAKFGNFSFTQYFSPLINDDGKRIVLNGPVTNLSLADLSDPNKKARFNLSNIASGVTRTVNIPNADSTTVQPSTAGANQFVKGINAQGVISYAQPSAAELSNGTTGSGAVVLSRNPNILYAFVADTYIEYNLSSENFIYLNANGGILNLPFAKDNIGRAYFIRVSPGAANAALRAKSGETILTLQGTSVSIYGLTTNKYLVIVSDGTQWIVFMSN